jgi:hypothetical protein
VPRHLAGLQLLIRLVVGRPHPKLFCSFEYVQDNNAFDNRIRHASCFNKDLTRIVHVGFVGTRGGWSAR